MVCKCLENKLKEWVYSFYPNIEKEEVNKFIFEAWYSVNLYRKRLDQYECHKSSKKNGYDRLSIDIKRISTTIDSISKNPILNYEQRQNLTNPLEKFKEQLEATYRECCFDRLIFTKMYKNNNKDAQAKLVVTGKIDSKSIRYDFINFLAVIFKRYTNSENIKRTKEQRSSNSQTPFLALLELLYNHIGIYKDKDSIQRDINRALSNCNN